MLFHNLVILAKRFATLDVLSEGRAIPIWQTIRNDRKKHIHMLKGALEKEIYG